MSRRNSGVALALALVFVASACNDNAPTALHQSGQASFSQLDGATAGNPHFYFLRPIAPDQPDFSGEFNGDLYPTVEICNGTSQTATNHCATLLARFTLDGGVNNYGAVISVPAGEQLYKVEWQTAAFDLPVGEPLRVVVLLGDFQAGFIDVAKSATGGFKNAETNGVISGNGTLPIKFRLENGVICGDNPNCTEQSVGPEGGLVTVEDDGNTIAGADIPPDAFPEPVNLIIEQVTDGECLPTDVQQFSLCYHYRTEPRLANFNIPVTVAFCMTDPAGSQYLSDGELRLWKWNEENGDPLVELERVTVDFLECPDLGGISYRSDSPWLRGLARAGGTLIAPVAKLVGPKPLYAIGSEGGKLINFSRIGWVRPLAVEITQGNNQTGYPGMPLPTNPTVRVKGRYGAGITAVAGRTVEFTPSADGAADPGAATSGVDGRAAAVWTLATATGANSLRARVPTSRPQAPAPYEAEVTFNATGADVIHVKWLPPLVLNSTVTGIILAGLTPEIEISVVGGSTIATLSMVESNGQYAANWNIPVLQSDKTYKIAVRAAGSERGHVLLDVVNGQLRNVSTGERVLNLKNSRNLPIKLVLYR